MFIHGAELKAGFSRYSKPPASSVQPPKSPADDMEREISQIVAKSLGVCPAGLPHWVKDLCHTLGRDSMYGLV